MIQSVIGDGGLDRGPTVEAGEGLTGAGGQAGEVVEDLYGKSGILAAPVCELSNINVI